MKYVVAYYSWQGHTEKVARDLAERLKAEVVKIEPVQDSGMFMKAMKAFLGLRSGIKSCRTDLADVDFLILASPVWAQKVPPYINEYTSMVSGSKGKPFSVLVEMGTSGAEKAIAIIRKKLENKGMKFVSSTHTLEKDVDAGNYGETLTEFVATITKV